MAYDVAKWRREVSATPDPPEDLPEVETSLPDIAIPSLSRQAPSRYKSADGNTNAEVSPNAFIRFRDVETGSKRAKAAAPLFVQPSQRSSNLPNFRRISPNIASAASVARTNAEASRSPSAEQGGRVAATTTTVIDLTDSPPAPAKQSKDYTKNTKPKDKGISNPYVGGLDTGFDTSRRLPSHPRQRNLSVQDLSFKSSPGKASTITISDTSGSSLPVSQTRLSKDMYEGQNLTAREKVWNQIRSENKRVGIPISIPSREAFASYPKTDPLATLEPNSPHSKIRGSINKGRLASSNGQNEAKEGYMTQEEREKATKEIVNSVMTNMDDVDTTEPMPDALTCTLLPHQITGVHWMKHREKGKNRGGILADDMGLGKTIQSTALILARKPPATERKPTLVVCPLSLANQWKSEILSKTDKRLGLKIYVYQGSGRTKDPAKLRRQDIVITTYQTVQYEMPNNGADKDDHCDADDTKLPNELTARKDAGPLFEVDFHRIILDEAHNIKNRFSKTAKACCALSSTYRWCLTGTPIQNHVDDIFSLFLFIGKSLGQWASWVHFQNLISVPMKKGKSTLASDRLKLVLSNVLLRRTKDTKIEDKPIIVLPNKEIKVIRTDFLDPDERAFYTALRDRANLQLNKFLKAGSLMSKYMHVLTLILRMRQACSHPHLVSSNDTKDMLFETRGAKLDTDDHDAEVEDLADALSRFGITKKTCGVCQIELSSKTTSTMNDKHCARCKDDVQRYAGLQFSTKIKKTVQILDDIKQDDPARKTIIFSQFTSMLDLVEPFLKTGGHKFVRLDGSMQREDREEALRKIKESSRYNIILVSLKTGAVGLNLACCSVVILLDLWWNPAIENQAIDRAYRFGQTRDVTVYKITIADTIEDRILTLQDQKRELAAGLLDGGAITKRMTEREMLFLFDRQAEEAYETKR